MMHYHGGPVTPVTAALALWKARHAMISFYNPEQVEIAAEICQSFALDNGAFSAWKAGGSIDPIAFADWAAWWGAHPGCDFAVIPDVIDGTERENDNLIAWWTGKAELRHVQGVPVWHLHESDDRLAHLCAEWPRVALGSSGAYAEPNTPEWWERMGRALNAICLDGRPPCKLHGLRMLNPTVFSQLPLASADSTAVARNVGIDQKWKGTYAPRSKIVRALILADRIEHHASAARWTGTAGTQMNMELIG